MDILTGVDIVKTSRIIKIINEDKKDAFLNKVFNESEIEYIKLRKYNCQTIAGLYAAKEAVSKLLGTGIGKVNFKHIEISHDQSGKPYVVLHDVAKEISKALKIKDIVISISHEKEYAVAFAVGEIFYEKEFIVIPENIKSILPKRRKDSHKGTYGRVGIIAGKKGMTGAAYLATMAALKSGSGLVYTITPNSISHILSMKLVEAIVRPVKDNGKGYFVLDSLGEIMDIIEKMDTVAIGPGIGVEDETVGLVKEILLHCKKTVILDADGLNCLSKIGLDILHKREGDTVITPHPGEFSRLIGVNTGEIQKNRIEYSKKISNKYNIIVVLKGSGTIVSGFNGELYINTTGNPGMATAGSGDVLTGIIASFVGQGIKAYDASVLGVYLHGLAGDLAKLEKGEYGMIARDILNNIPYSIKYLEKDNKEI